MKIIKKIACGAIVLLFIACNNHPHVSKSRLEHFEYGGYGDTIFATLYGQVFEDASSKVPLQNAMITILNNGQRLKTDSLGKFEFYSEADTFSLEVYYPDHQTLVLKNYISHPDQISTAQIILTKGKGVEQVVIPSSTPQ